MVPDHQERTVRGQPVESLDDRVEVGQEAVEHRQHPGQEVRIPGHRSDIKAAAHSALQPVDDGPGAVRTRVLATFLIGPHPHPLPVIHRVLGHTSAYPLGPNARTPWTGDRQTPAVQ